MKNEVLRKQSFEFACNIIDVSDELISKRKFSIADQLLRSGTSIAANIRESFYAESKKDYVHKLSISMKESEECKFWIELIETKSIVNITAELKDQLDHIQRTISILLKSTRERM